MAIPSRQIGWGTEENLLWQISKQLERLTNVAYAASNTPHLSNVPEYTDNADAIANGFRVFSSYKLSESENVWIITEADRSITTILLPDEY